MTALEQINRIADQLPLEVLQDIRTRIGDWMAGGGGVDDPYIYQQLRYARRFERERKRPLNNMQLAVHSQ